MIEIAAGGIFLLLFVAYSAWTKWRVDHSRTETNIRRVMGEYVQTCFVCATVFGTLWFSSTL